VDNLVVELLVTFFFGMFGVHKFMQKKIFMGIVYLFTGGLFGIGWIVDIFVVLGKMVKGPEPLSTNVVNTSIQYNNEPKVNAYGNRIPERTEFPPEVHIKVEPKAVVCEYCGEPNDSKNTKCSNCGASLSSNY
jgi:hypothetical protein